MPKPTPKRPALLAGGHPKIAKSNGDQPVQAYIEAMPGWTREVGQRLDQHVCSHVPGVKKGIRWNSPMYGVEGQGWFVSIHAFTRCVKVTFFRGMSLQPAPPRGTAKEMRWIDIHEHDLDSAQLIRWIQQAAAIPGWGKQ
jgi:hypothetical protein